MNFAYKKNIVFYQNRKAWLLCGFVVVLCAIAVNFTLAEGEVLSGSTNNVASQSVSNQDMINQKIEEIKKIQAEINQYQSEIKNKQAENKSLKNAISIYDSNIAKNQLEIKQTKLDIERTEMEIAQASMQIEDNQQKIEEYRKSLKNFLQALYDYQQDSMFEVLISQDNISDFFNEVDAIESVQEDIFKTVVALRQEKNDLTVKSEQLEQGQEAYKNLIEIKTEQNASIESLKGQKNEILEITKGEEGKYQELLSQNQSVLPSLRAELRDLQSLGSSIKFDDAISAAKYVGGVTGVRPAFLLGVLRVESGLGTNVGGGTYLVDMNPSQRPTFEAIAAELGYDPNSMPVSKKPKTYSGWGGAMGPAQMMPTTWRIYQAQASQITGHYPADPWDLTDSIAGMAVKLSAIEGVTAANYDAEYKAAGMYFAGTNWQRFLFYPDKVMYYTDLYEKELGG